MNNFNILYTPAMRYKIASTGFEFYGYKLPIGALYGTISERYYYTHNTALHDFIEKNRALCTPFSFIVDDFTPLFYVLDYQKQKHAVFHVKIWDEKNHRWISTNTGAHQKYYLLGEYIEEIAIMREVLNTKCLYNHLYQKDVQRICGERKNGYSHKGSAYGYMCKTPDRTTTEYDLVGDTFAENRKLKKA